jgi:Nitroreductase family
MGITRDDTEGRRITVLRNWEFFQAPLTGIVGMHRDLHYVDSLGVGMFLQTFLLGLTARGLGTCVQVSIDGYPEIVREQLNISQEYAILCGMAIGDLSRQQSTDRTQSDRAQRRGSRRLTGDHRLPVGLDQKQLRAFGHLRRVGAQRHHDLVAGVAHHVQCQLERSLFGEVRPHARCHLRIDA